MNATQLEITRDQIEKYRDLDRQIKALEKEKEAIGKELKSGFFLSNTDFTYNDRLLATYRPELRVTLDQAKLKADYQAIYEECCKISEIRVMRLK